jgi:DNA-directed RNA polymerase subunit RPC12/RpoP
MKNEWVLGRAGDIKIGHDSVSSRHAKLTRDGDSMILEDLGSTNGTYVNGAQVVRVVVKPSDTIVLGAYTVDLRQLLAGAMTEDDYAAAFARLRDVYETHSRAKIAMQSTGAGRTTLVRAVPAALGMLLGALVGRAFGGSYVPLIGGAVGSAIGGLVGAFLASDASKKQVVEMAELTRKFQTYYVCPKCKRFFGDVPFEALQNQGACPSCKSRFQPQ